MKTPSLFRRLAGDERGISAVEFALLAPLMIAFYMGMAEFCQGYMANKRMGHVSAMVADLVSQEATVTTTNVDDIFSIGRLIMKPFPTTTLKQRVSAVTMTSGRARIVWSRGSGGMLPRAVNSEITLPADMIVNTQSIIVSEATYNYSSPVKYVMPGVTQFSSIYYLRPRIVEAVVCSNC